MTALRPFGIPLSTIGRPVDLRYPTNRAIAVLSLLTLIAGALLGLARGEAWIAGLLGGLAWGGSVFLAWALARETDPDRWFSAYFAAGGALAGVILLGKPHFLLLFWILLGLRTVNQSTGLAPGVVDWIGLYGVNLWLGFSAHWTIPLLTLPTIFFAGLRRFPIALRMGLPVVLPVAAVAYGFLHEWRFAIPAGNSTEILVLVGIAIVLVPVIASYRTVRSAGDRTGERLMPHRVQWALVWAIGVGLVLTLSGTSTVRDIAPLWGALAGTSLGWAIDFSRRRLRAT